MSLIIKKVKAYYTSNNTTQYIAKKPLKTPERYL